MRRSQVLLAALAITLTWCSSKKNTLGDSSGAS